MRHTAKSLVLGACACSLAWASWRCGGDSGQAAHIGDAGLESGVVSPPPPTNDPDRTIPPSPDAGRPETGPYTFEVPYEQPPYPDKLAVGFIPKLPAVDVAFVVDTTTSMESAITELRTNLAGRIIPALTSSIASVAVAVVDFRDWTEWWTVDVRAPIPASSPTDVSAALSALTQMSTGDAGPAGNDDPEAQIAALLHTVTGERVEGVPLPADAGAFSGSYCRPMSDPCKTVEAHTPDTGRFGGVDFREGAVPFVVLVTDQAWHEPSGTATFLKVADSINAIRSRNAYPAYFVGLLELHGNDVPSPPELEDQQNRLSDETSSNLPAAQLVGVCDGGSCCPVGKCCTGVGGAARDADGPDGSCRLNYRISNGRGLTDGVVAAVQAASASQQFNVRGTIVNDPANPGGVDATIFVQSMRALEEGDPAKGCDPHAAIDADGDGVKESFTSVLRTANLCFLVAAKTNKTVQPVRDAQVFKIFLDVFSVPNNVRIARQEIYFKVPSRADSWPPH